VKQFRLKNVVSTRYAGVTVAEMAKICGISEVGIYKRIKLKWYQVIEQKGGQLIVVDLDKVDVSGLENNGYLDFDQYYQIFYGGKS